MGSREISDLKKRRIFSAYKAALRRLEYDDISTDEKNERILDIWDQVAEEFGVSSGDVVIISFDYEEEYRKYLDGN